MPLSIILLDTGSIWLERISNWSLYMCTVLFQEQDSDTASRSRVDSGFSEVHKGKEIEKSQEEAVTSNGPKKKESTGHPPRTPQQSINGNGANLPKAIPEDTHFHGFLTMTRINYPSGGSLPPPDPSDGTTSEGKRWVYTNLCLYLLWVAIIACLTPFSHFWCLCFDYVSSEGVGTLLENWLWRPENNTLG